MSKGVPPLKEFHSIMPIVDPIQTPKEDFLIKVILCGDASVGKTSIMKRATGKRVETTEQSTIGVDFDHLSVNNVRFMIWDTAGQERFRSVSRAYYRGSHVALIVFDLSRLETFHKVESYIKDLKMEAPGASMYLIGNKSDMTQRMDRIDAEAIAFLHNLMYYETSATTGANIKEIFEFIADHVGNIAYLPEDDEKTLRLNSVVINQTIKKRNCC